MIPVTDKYWIKCKFDENFNEVSYVDNRGKSYEFIDPIKGTLKFYKNDNIDITQEMLDNFKYIKTGNRNEELFLEYFSNLTFTGEVYFFRECLFFCNSHDNRIMINYNHKRGILYYYFENLMCQFQDINYVEGIKYLEDMFEKHFNMKNVKIISLP